MKILNRKETVMPTVQESVVILISVCQPIDPILSLCRSLAGFKLVCVGGNQAEIDQLTSYSDVLIRNQTGEKGGAIQAGLRYIADNPAYVSFRYIVMVDTLYEPSAVIRIAETVCETGGMILGSRSMPTGAKFLDVVERLVFRVASGKGISDPTTGLRAVEREKAGFFAEISGEGDAYAIHMLFAALDEKIPVKEVPIDYKGMCQRPVRDTFRFCLSVFFASRSLKYLFSSGVAFVIDYALLILLDGTLPIAASMELAAPAAWIVSSFTNFFLNRNFVFQSSEPLAVALPEYYGLAGVVFLLKTYVLLEIMTRLLHIPLTIAKLAAEVVFFVFNYFIQKKFIFKQKPAKRNG